ncbi:MAG: hypothetical protein LAO31_14720 [Acidobacteriia bacterium]|nr:hypothetical protein [Terriglobia bacterium]
MKKLSMWVLLSMLATSAFATTRLPFIEDDYPRALFEAKRQKLPVFVEVWAPW